MYPYSFLMAMLGVPTLGLPFAWTFGSDLNAQVQPVFEGMIPQGNNIPQWQSAIEGFSGLAPPSFLIHTGSPPTWLAISHLFQQSAAK
jgi:hypothetical protein